MILLHWVWHMPAILALGKLRQKGCELKCLASLRFVVRSCPQTCTQTDTQKHRQTDIYTIDKKTTRTKAKIKTKQATKHGSWIFNQFLYIHLMKASWDFNHIWDHLILYISNLNSTCSIHYYPQYTAFTKPRTVHSLFCCWV